MANLQNISELQPTLPFTEYDFYKKYQATFKSSLLGKIYELLPLHEMAVNFGLIDSDKKSGSHKEKRRGRPSYFTPEGKVALMFLRMYTELSAPKLLEQLNGNVHYQIFCGIIIDPEYPLTNYKLIDDISLELSRKLKIQQQQEILANIWKPYMKKLDEVFTDATCYESYMRYPTDAKLLWESCEKSYEIMCRACKLAGENRYRTKYNDIATAYLVYAKQRRHKKKQTHHIIGRMLKLLAKILKKTRGLIRNQEVDKKMSDKDLRNIDVVTRIYRQQHNHYKSKNVKESIPNRIVSINKPYIRPIVRGKETKTVEFGAKCNNILVDGISFIEKLSFNAFNEGTRLSHCIKLCEKLFQTKVKKFGGDQGYTSNANRSLCTANGIDTSFPRKGKAGKEEESKRKIRHELARIRATSMEGSFGTQKEHYGLHRVKARLKETETLMIFFGIHTGNAVILGRRLLAKEVSEEAEDLKTAG